MFCAPLAARQGALAYYLGPARRAAMATGAARRAIPRISTRGSYDLRTGAATRRQSRYTLWPPRRFESVAGAAPEIAIVVHGMRNGRAGAAQKFALAQRRLRALGYRHPVVGYTYDADVRGAHAAATAARAARTAEAIAVRNGARLAAFIADRAAARPRARVRLLGHSLGSLVIDGALRSLDARGMRGAVESVHLFGASLEEARAASGPSRRAAARVVRRRVVNCCCATDEVLRAAAAAGEVRAPIGLAGIRASRRPARYSQRPLRARNHRFASYLAALRSFP